MRVGMHEMHALRVRGFFHGNDRGDLMLVLLLWIGQVSGRVGGVMTQPYRGDLRDIITLRKGRDMVSYRQKEE